jgi:Major Facilitator Superfamily
MTVAAKIRKRSRPQRRSVSGAPVAGRVGPRRVDAERPGQAGGTGVGDADGPAPVAPPDPVQREQGMVGGLGAAFGPVLSGLLVTAFGWRAVFVVNLPVGAVGCLLVARLVPAPGGAGGRGLDVPAQAAAVVSLAGLTIALNEAGSLGWGAPLVLGGFVLCVAGLAGFLVAERRSAAPMLPLALFRRAEFTASVGVGVLLNLGFYGLLFLAPLYFHRVLGLSALATGLALLPMAGMAAVSSPLAGKVTARTGPRLPMAAGLVVGAAGLAGWLTAAPTAATWCWCCRWSPRGSAPRSPCRPPPPRSWRRHRPSSPERRRRCSTRPGRWAACSVWRCSGAWCRAGSCPACTRRP